MRKRGIFITGTDTGVGKTFFSCGLARVLRDSGLRVGVMKPAETGCALVNGALVPDDAVRLKDASGCDVPLEKICPYRFPEPLAPSVAAEREKTRVDIDRLMQLYNEISSSHDVTLVEGAGGLMVPILPSYTYADLAAVLKLPLLVIAANRLGVINHLVLTLEHATCKSLRVLAYVLNQISNETSPATETNRATLSALTAVPCMGELPFYNGSFADSPLLSGFAEELDMGILSSVLT